MNKEGCYIEHVCFLSLDRTAQENEKTCVAVCVFDFFFSQEDEDERGRKNLCWCLFF